MRKLFAIGIVTVLVIAAAGYLVGRRGFSPVAGVLTGTVSVGPTCPVERIPPEPSCAPKPLATTLTLTRANGSRIIKTFSSDASGRFGIEAPAGQYVIRSASNKPFPRCAATTPFTVRAGATTTVTVSCDSGIR